MMKNTNNYRFEAASKKLKEMIWAKFGDPEKEMYRIMRTCKNIENGKERMRNIMALWKFDPEVSANLNKIWDEVNSVNFEQLEMGNEI